jgi:L,D-transpeptidase catalytic domain
MMKNFMAAALAVVFAVTSLAPTAFAATKGKDEKVLLLKKKKPVQAVQKLPATPEKKLVNRRDCKGFMQCLFGTRKVRVVTAGGGNQQYASLAAVGLSGRKSRKVVDWNEKRYPVGSIVVKTPERALYLITGDGEAIRYAVGVGREGFQWSGNAKIARKAEWPSWTPPAVMIKREAEKGHIIPPFMEGGPGNPLGARALYIGGKIFRVHGTNNEASIGGAVSSGCIRMMNADVIDLYERVKVGTPIYVLQ